MSAHRRRKAPLKFQCYPIDDQKLAATRGNLLTLPTANRSSATYGRASKSARERGIGGSDSATKEIGRKDARVVATEAVKTRRPLLAESGATEGCEA